MKYRILITCFLLKILTSSMCISVSKVTRTHGKGVNCETLGATEPGIDHKIIASLVDVNRDFETRTSIDESHSNVQGCFNKHPMNKISVKSSSDGESETIKRQVIQGAAHRGRYASGYEDISNGNSNKTSAKLISLLEGILNLHSGVDQTTSSANTTDMEKAVLPTEVKVIPTNTNSTDLSEVLDLFKMVTFKISREAFSKLFFPDDSNTESNAFNKLTPTTNSNIMRENILPPKTVKKERPIKTEIRNRKVPDERLAGGKENTALSQFDKNYEIKHHNGKKNIEAILKDMDELIAKQFGKVKSQRLLPATTRSPLHMDAILKQMQILIDSSSEIPSEHSSTYIKKFQSTVKQDHKAMPEIIDEMDKLLHVEGVKSSSKTSSASDFQSILDQMEAVIQEQNKFAANAGTSRALRSRRRRSLWGKDRKTPPSRSRLLVSPQNYRTFLSTKEQNEDPCTLPYVDVAYKVCILPVLDRQLSWHDAHQYCRSRGLELAMDSAVNKGRKYFNNQLGETGTRERWTLWVGGRKGEEKWEWNDGIPVPDFLWSKNQPRTYDRDSTPTGTCMAIDGFSEYYGTALPCHNRRRFVCQKL